MWDEEKPKPSPRSVIGEDLTTLSLAELEARIATLRAEIARTEAEITRKAAQAKLAQDFFKS